MNWIAGSDTSQVWRPLHDATVPRAPFLRRHGWAIGLGAAVVLGLYLTSIYSYLLFHTLSELFSIVVAFSIFVITWNCRHFIQNGYLVFIGIAYLSLGLLDLLHTLSYAGMPVFPGYSFIANQLWIAARFMESLALLVGFTYLSAGRQPNPALLLTGFVLVTSLIIATIFVWRIFPVCFVAGQGQTTFKILSEYVIMAILAVDAALLAYNRTRFEQSIYRALLGATLLAILTEAAFTLYVSNYGPSNMVGHFLKVFSYYLIYVAIVKHGVEQPFELVFREFATTNRRLEAEVKAHRTTELELKQEQLYSTSILESLPGIFYLYTYPELKLELWNKRHESLLGYEPGEIKGRYAADWFPQEAQAAVLEAIEGVMQGGDGTLEAPLLAKDGHLIPFFFMAIPFEMRGQRYLMGTGTDLTERHLAEAEKFKLQAQLQQAQKMESLGSLAGGVAHDMNNVLGAILGISSASMVAQPTDSPTHRAFDTITQAATRGGKLVKSLLSFARQSPVAEAEVDVNEVIREGVRMLERTTSASVRIETDLERDLGPIRGDASALHHAFLNLWVNAVDAMPEGGTLTLRTRTFDATWIEVIVEDTGTGMPSEVMDKALDPFFTTKEVGKGTGLGLSMVYRTVKAHGGQLQIQSEVGQGTRIILRFPACEALPKALEAKHELHATPPRP